MNRSALQAFVLELPEGSTPVPTGNPERDRELERCASASVRLHRSYAWLLGDHAARALLGRPLSALSPRKDENGKLLIDGGWISWSHSRGAVAAIVSNAPVGIDLELQSLRADRRSFAEKVLTPAEATAFALLPEEERLPFLFACWTGKEALFKRTGGAVFRPDTIDTFQNPALAVWTLTLGGRPFSLSVAAEGAETAAVRRVGVEAPGKLIDL